MKAEDWWPRLLEVLDFGATPPCPWVPPGNLGQQNERQLQVTRTRPSLARSEGERAGPRRPECGRATGGVARPKAGGRMTGALLAGATAGTAKTGPQRTPPGEGRLR